MTLENNYDIKSLTTPAATGGTITTTATQRIHTFTSSGTFTVNKAMNIEVLVVAGGGGGGGNGPGDGGGGAGGLLYNSSYAIGIGNMSITVGNGGVRNTNGYNSVFGTLTAIGGGRGGEYQANESAGIGGSGGGGSGRWTSRSGAAGTAGQGYAGGWGYVGTADGAGGGGGAGGVGAAGVSNTRGGNGGIGLQYSISGSPTYYAGGGGGGTDLTNMQGAGGLGGGGRGQGGTVGVTGGTANTGGGGGGGSATTGSNAGGSGIVIIRYLLSEDIIPANITATNMSITTTDSPCRVGICTINVSVTWTNNGGSIGSFVPNITVSSGTVTPTYSSEQLAIGSTITHSFTVSGMTAGTCSICPNPN